MASSIAAASFASGIGAAASGASVWLGAAGGTTATVADGLELRDLDGAPVDLICLLIAPETAGADHLKALARMARVLRDTRVAAKLRAARDVSALYAVLTGETASHAA